MPQSSFQAVTIWYNFLSVSRKLDQHTCVLDTCRISRHRYRLMSVSRNVCLCRPGSKDGPRSVSSAVAAARLELCTPDSVGKVDLLVTHIESLCYFWAQVADQEMAQRMAVLTVGMQQAQLPTVNGRLQPRTVCILSASSPLLCLMLFICVSTYAWDSLNLWWYRKWQ